ncbi:MAG: hypothetical protein KBG22_12160 [Smithella sp.]|nr:hypothetical protein [Smithella sp.]
MNIAALLTAKGSSTLTSKNLMRVGDRPLVWYPAAAASRSTLISSFWTSSDSHEILGIGRELGFEPILRPAELARAESRHVDAILHALDFMAEKQCYPDILVVLLGNNVTTKTEWIDEGINMILEDKTISAAVPVINDQDHHPYRAKQVDNKGFLEPFFDFTGKNISTNRQELVPCYFLCHNFWVLNISLSVRSAGGQKPWDFMGNRVRPIFTDGCFDVHDKEDIPRCERWLEENRNSLTFETEYKVR